MSHVCSLSTLERADVEACAPVEQQGRKQQQPNTAVRLATSVPVRENAATKLHQYLPTYGHMMLCAPLFVSRWRESGNENPFGCRESTSTLDDIAIMADARG